jgi:hypothetical protein
MSGDFGSVWIWTDGYGGYLENNRWYCVEQYCRMNTVGSSDGVLRAWVDGKPAFEKTDIRMRTVDNLKIERIWMNVYHGGTDTAIQDMDLYFDNVVIARSYIGPLASNAPVAPQPGNNAAAAAVPHALTCDGRGVTYTLRRAGRCRLTVSTLNGEHIATFVDGVRAAGTYRVSLRELPSAGVYLVRLETEYGDVAVAAVGGSR